jgi:DNA helicase-2/ATP-dependent DNA helicase PcrA
MSAVVLSPAEQAAEEARVRIHACIDMGKSFLVEAGAGAGKTHSLIEALKYVIAKRGTSLIRMRQQVACITYTNVATEQIEARTDRHPAIRPSTIHAFCWSLLKGFQPHLRKALSSIPAWTEKLSEAGDLGLRNVVYDESGRRNVSEASVSLHHDDVLTLTVILMKEEKFRGFLTAQYPVLFIDEYQDTEREVVESLKEHFLGKAESPLIGFFGDNWQKIYGSGCGEITHPALEVIGKGANFRSDPVIVECLNRMRPNLQQQVRDTAATGSVMVYHTNDWTGTRLTGQHWGGDLPANVSHTYLDQLKTKLVSEGWDLSSGKTKILMLTHKVLAAEQGYENIAKAFPYNDSFVKKEDPHIAFFVDVVEPLCAAYLKKKYGEMFKVLGIRTPRIVAHDDKVAWTKDMDDLIALRETGTVGQTIDLLKRTGRPRLSEAAETREKELEQAGVAGGEESGRITSLRMLKEVSYTEVIRVTEFINEHTLFSTKHGVKGAEFENVLVIFGRGWNHYNFNEFLELAPRPPSDAKGKEKFERNRNLFYVACSRPKKRLAILFTQQLTAQALSTLSSWFGDGSIRSMGRG